MVVEAGPATAADVEDGARAVYRTASGWGYQVQGPRVEKARSPQAHSTANPSPKNPQRLISQYNPPSELQAQLFLPFFSIPWIN